MSKQTYYIVQTTPTDFLHERGVLGGYVEGRGAKDAAHLAIDEARKLWRAYCAIADKDLPRRFPRIIKVTTEMKTITQPRR